VVVTALCTAAAFALAGVLATPAFAKSCHSSGHKIYSAHGIVVFTKADHGDYPVFICASPSGNVKRIASLSTGASVGEVKRVGHYVAFFLNTNEEVYSQYLIAYNRDRGRVELSDLAQCEDNDECPTFAQLVGFVLASNGWVAERWANLFLPGDALLAYNGGSRHYQLEFGGVRDLSLRGNTVHWVSQIGGESSAVLGSGVVPNPHYRSLSPCKLLTTSDLEKLLGAAIPETGPGSGECTYNGARGEIQVLLTTGLSSSARSAQITDLEGDSYYEPSQWWPGNVDFTDFGDDSGATTGPQTDGFAGFYRGIEVQVVYQGNTDQEAAASHLTTVVLERLLRVDVKRLY
jgi:hypothetical protein